MRSFLLLALLAALTFAADRTVFFRRFKAPKGWVQGGKAKDSAPVTFMLGLKQRNLDALERIFWAVSDPRDSQYQNFMTYAEISELTAPAPENKQVVLDWLNGANLSGAQVAVYSDAIEVKTTVGKASKLFDTTFHEFKAEENGHVTIRAMGDMSWPKEIAAVCDMMEGIWNFPVPHLAAHTAPEDNYAAIPQTYATIYNIPSTTGESSSSVGVIEFEGENYAPQDLQSFAQGCGITITPVTKAHTVGPNDPSQPQIEAELDIQIVAGTNTGVTSWFWLVPGEGWLWTFATKFAATPAKPSVISISYAWSEMDQCQINPDECQSLGVDSQGYVAKVNTEWQKIGLQGISILTASGDSGANGRTDPDCSLPYLKPDYPACSPYVTSVGATQLNNAITNLPNPPPFCNEGYACLSGGQEVAVSYDVADFASGGGFSWYSPMPSYQTKNVNAYFASGVTLPPASYYNASNRGHPDLAAIGHDCLIYDGGIEPVGGTSCATPLWASVIGSVNYAQIKKTGKPLGFLNPFLYQMAADCPDCFTDIIVGDNLCTEDGCSSSCEGFYATTGWDPVTGLGSPMANNIIAYVNNGMKYVKN